MASAKAWYWVAAGVLALGINSEYQNGRMEWAHRYVDHSVALVREYSACAARQLAMAETLLGAGQANLGSSRSNLEQPQARLDHEQVRLAFANTQIAQRQLGCHRLRIEMAQRGLERHPPDIEMVERELERVRPQIEMTQRLAIQGAGNVRVVCPRTRIQVTIPEIPAAPLVAYDGTL